MCLVATASVAQRDKTRLRTSVAGASRALARAVCVTTAVPQLADRGPAAGNGTRTEVAASVLERVSFHIRCTFKETFT